MLRKHPTASRATWHQTGHGQHSLRNSDGSEAGATVEYSGGIWRVYVGGKQVGRRPTVAEAMGLARSLI